VARKDRLPLKEYRKFLVWHWWLIHNCLAHPLIGLFPFRPFFWFHDWTALKKDARTAG